MVHTTVQTAHGPNACAVPAVLTPAAATHALLLLPARHPFLSRSYNIRNSTSGQIEASAFLNAMSDCLREHDARKQANADLRMVVLADFSSITTSMSGDIGMAGRQVARWAAQRPDVLFMGSASQIKLRNGTIVPAYPGRFPEFMAVTSTSLNGTWAPQLAAPTPWTSVAAPGEYIMCVKDMLVAASPR